MFIKDTPLVLDDSCAIRNFSWDNGHSAANWSWNANLQELCQTTNSRPTSRFCGWSLDNANLQGRVQVKTTSDDDYLGFLWGLQAFDPMVEDPTDFYFLSWKQGNQLGFCGPGTGRAGVIVKRITVEDPVNSPLTCADFHAPTDTPNSKVLATEDEFTTQGWIDNVAYIFDLTHTPQGFTVKLIRESNMALVAEKEFEDNTYPNGQVGFYSYSQQSTCFSQFKTSCL